MAYLGSNSLPFVNTWVHSRFFGGVRVTFKFSVLCFLCFVLTILCVL
jgi:hypothetical protein